MTPPTRRGLLGTAAAGLSAAPVAVSAGPHPDAELVKIGRAAIPLIAEYMVAFRAFLAADADTPEMYAADKASDGPWDALEAMSDRSLELRATTPEGAAAKARLARFWMFINNSTDGVLDEQMDWYDQVAWSALTDMADMDGRAAA